jgi:hypothetical protein
MARLVGLPPHSTVMSKTNEQNQRAKPASKTIAARVVTRSQITPESGGCVMSPTREYWFPAKRYGWGWGFPVSWQGWTALIVYFLLLGLVAVRFQPVRHPFAFGLLVVVLSIALVAVCWLKGEPPRWRWGKD